MSNNNESQLLSNQPLISNNNNGEDETVIEENNTHNRAINNHCQSLVTMSPRVPRKRITSNSNFPREVCNSFFLFYKI